MNFSDPNINMILNIAISVIFAVLSVVMLRICMTVIAVTAYMVVRDGVGEEGLLSAGKFYPWNIVRSYDFEERKNVIAVYFTVESQNEKKPDEYVTKELDFSKEDQETLMKFLKLNLGRKYTRMKKKQK